jgi:DNA-binding NarL/FixJ family response regulator
MKRSTILLADDHTVVIEGLHRILNRPEFEIVGSAADGRALLEATARLRPDVIIVDVSMPLLNGIDAAREILKQKPKAKIIFLTMHSEAPYAAAAFAAGASGYVLKSAAGAELIEAIQKALSGRVYVSKTIAKSLDRSRSIVPANTQSTVSPLTSRQREVLQLLAEGRQVKEIAVILSISPKTVEFHKYRIMDLLGVHTVAGLARYALKRGIVT